MGLLYFLSLRAKFGLYGVDIIPMSGFTFFSCHLINQKISLMTLWLLSIPFMQMGLDY